jgi:hypothetical protein
MARLDSGNVPNRVTFPETQDIPMTIVIEVRHRLLPKARDLIALRCPREPTPLKPRILAVPD